MYIHIQIKGKVKYMRSIHLNIPFHMHEQLDAIAKKENKPRSFIIREMLNKGIEERESKQGKKQNDNY